MVLICSRRIYAVSVVLKEKGNGDEEAKHDQELSAQNSIVDNLIHDLRNYNIMIEQAEVNLRMLRVMAKDTSSRLTMARETLQNVQAQTEAIKRIRSSTDLEKGICKHSSLLSM